MKASDALAEEKLIFASLFTQNFIYLRESKRNKKSPSGIRVSQKVRVE